MEIIRSELVKKIFANQDAREALRRALQQSNEERTKNPQVFKIEGKSYRLRFGNYRVK